MGQAGQPVDGCWQVGSWEGRMPPAPKLDEAILTELSHVMASLWQCPLVNAAD